MYEFYIKELKGNNTAIQPTLKAPKITPINTTSTVTANLPQKGNKVPQPPKANVEFTKNCVDENHK